VFIRSTRTRTTSQLRNLGLVDPAPVEALLVDLTTGDVEYNVNIHWVVDRCGRSAGKDLACAYMKAIILRELGSPGKFTATTAEIRGGAGADQSLERLNCGAPTSPAAITSSASRRRAFHKCNECERSAPRGEVKMVGSRRRQQRST
jgi:hypothetical protein